MFKKEVTTDKGRYMVTVEIVPRYDHSTVECCVSTIQDGFLRKLVNKERFTFGMLHLWMHAIVSIIKEAVTLYEGSIKKEHEYDLRKKVEKKECEAFLKAASDELKNWDGEMGKSEG